MNLFYDYKDKIEKIKNQCDSNTVEILKLYANKPASTQEYADRIADLEIKMGKLWALLVKQDQAGNDKLSKYGKVFGGKSKEWKP